MRVQRAKKTTGASELLPFKDVCQRLGIHYVTGYKHRSNGCFPIEVLVIGDRYYCRLADVNAYTHARAVS